MGGQLSKLRRGGTVLPSRIQLAIQLLPHRRPYSRSIKVESLCVQKEKRERNLHLVTGLVLNRSGIVILNLDIRHLNRTAVLDLGNLNRSADR